jgi:endonuclease/exonuclease/phosphatase (EEP) superfamily protein YafD
MRSAADQSRAAVDSPASARRIAIRIVSANLASGRADARSFARLVHALGADVVAVQELAGRQAEALARVLPFGILAVRPYRMGLALQRPGSVRAIPLPGRDAYAGEAAADASGALITVVNTHVIAPHRGWPWVVAALRRRQVQALEAYLGMAPRPLVLVGDLNSTPLWPAYRRLSRTLSDAAVEAARGEGRRPARTWGLGLGPRLFRIDHALVDGVIVEKVQLLPIDGSNHHALVLDVRRPARSLTGPGTW